MNSNLSENESWESRGLDLTTTGTVCMFGAMSLQTSGHFGKESLSFILFLTVFTHSLIHIDAHTLLL